MKYIHLVFLLLILSLVYTCKTQHSQKTKTVNKLSHIWSPEDKAFFKHLDSLPKHNLAEWGKIFVGLPYGTKTLEKGNDLYPVINFQEMDCTTFVETVLTLSNLQKFTEDEYTKMLTYIRYKDGIAKGFAYRLNYFSHWIVNNQKKGIVKDITKSIGGEPVNKKINYMSSHKQFYPKLKDNNTLIKIKAIEQELSQHRRYILPKMMVESKESEIKDGDIIVFSSSIEGLDFVHVGLAVRSKKNQRIYLLHASSDSNKITISKNTLFDYIKGNTKMDGIAVIRPVKVEK